jgi:uncharacterized protein YcfJ
MSINVTPIPRLIDLAAPAFSLGTANAAGSAVTAVSSNSTLLAFDTTLPDAITYGQSGAVGSSTTAARRSHVHAMAAEPTAYTDAEAIAAVEGEATLTLAGTVLGRSVGKGFAGQNATNAGVCFAGNNAQVNVADNETFNIVMSNQHGILLLVGDDAANACGAFFCSEQSSTVVKLADPGNAYDVTDVDNSKVAIFKGAGSQTVTIKNYRNSTISLGVNVLGPVSAATAPG